MKHLVVTLVACLFLSFVAEVESASQLGELAPLVGTWCSELDAKYKDHPMVRQFNPDLKPQELIFAWGDDRAFLRFSIWDLDRPNDGDRTLVVRGLVLPNAATGELVLVDFNVPSSAAYLGRWAVHPAAGRPPAAPSPGG